MCARLPARTLPLSVGSYAFLRVNRYQRRSPHAMATSRTVRAHGAPRTAAQTTVHTQTLYYDIYYSYGTTRVL